jgi:hypothetical protein
MVVALLVMEFDIQLATGENGEALLNDSKDLFTMSVTDLRLVFNPREAA